MALSVQHGLTLHQIDVTTAFLNGKLDKEVYMHPCLREICMQIKQKYLWVEAVSSLLEPNSRYVLT